MTMDEETGLYSMGQGCPIHGDEHMKECSMCGAEFCRICHPRSAVCPDCAADSESEDEEAPDFDDVRNLDELLDEDEEVDELVKEDGDFIPPEDLKEEEDEK